MSEEPFVPCAELGIFGGVSLLIDVREEDGETYVYSKFSCDEEVRRSLVQYSVFSGEPFFMYNQTVYYLSEFMKIS